MTKKSFSVDFFAKKDEDGKLKDVILAIADRWAEGHYFDDYQLWTDTKTLEMWAELGNESGRVVATVDHSDKVGAKIGWFSNFRVQGSVLLADLELRPVAFTRATNFIGDYIMNVIDSEDTEFVQVSVETEIVIDDSEFDEEKKRVYMRPSSLTAASFVFEGALTEKLFAAIRENEGEYQMEEDKKEEVTDEVVAEVDEEVTDEVTEEVTDEVVAEVDEETTDEVTDEVVAEEEEVEEETTDEESDEKDEDESEMEEDTSDDDDDDEEELQEEGPDIVAEISEVKGMLQSILDLLAPKESEEMSQKKSEEKMTSEKPKVFFLNDIEDTDPKNVDPKNISDEELRKNWRKYWSNPELKERIISMK